MSIIFLIFTLLLNRELIRLREVLSLLWEGHTASGCRTGTRIKFVSKAMFITIILYWVQYDVIGKGYDLNIILYRMKLNLIKKIMFVLCFNLKDLGTNLWQKSKLCMVWAMPSPIFSPISPKLDAPRSSSMGFPSAS